VFGNAIETLYSNPDNIEAEVRQADLVIGGVLVVGGAAPKLVRRHHLDAMEDGSVVVDVAVDQGGCIETCRPTTHDNPTFVEHGVVHYCVANMPGAVPQTSTVALTNATLPIALQIAREGLAAAARNNIHISRGINTLAGACVCAPVAEAHGLTHTPLSKVL
jgi:alanine dehydrogenase